ncbi:MAG TPA: FAD-dependent oxidoreductase, partial [Nitrospinota bacterium]|jgi:protoporphyrinogen oxidase|nr:FAD-dependent oxidoreductase [Nitrospinota bacterium]
MKVVIFGAGPCGLTAAWELAKNGVTPIVIEKEASVGGLCKTIRQNGYQYDLGGHRFISKDSELIDDIRALMSDELLTRTRKSIIRFHDRKYDYPINCLNVFKQASLWMSLKFALGYSASLSGLSVSSSPQDSFERWVDVNFGKPLNEYFFKPYTEKLWGIPASELSDDWAAQRISLLNAGMVLLKALRLTRATPRTYASKYLYPKKGVGSIFEKMTVAIKNSGGKVLTGTQPFKFETSGNRICRVLVENSNGKKNYIEADQFLSTIPLDSLAQLLGFENPPALLFRSLRFLNIELNRETLSPNTWMYIPEDDFIMTRIQEPKHRSPFSAPNGKTSAILEIPCDKGDAIWNMSNEKLLKRVIKDMQSLGFDIEKEISGSFSTWAEHAYPCYKIGYMKKVEKMRNFVNRFENITTLGRQGLFRYIFMDTAMVMGRNWAKTILGQSRENPIEEMDSKPVLLETESVA